MPRDVLMSARSAITLRADTGKPRVPGQGVYLGAILLEEQTSMEQLNRDTGVRHAMFMTFLSFPEVLDAHHPDHGKALRFIRDCKAVSAVPVITLECFGGLNSYAGGDIARFADLLDGFEVPLILRWNHEMNGSWYPWGQLPELYVRRFREFAETVNARAPAVAMAWTPNQGWGYPWPMCKHFNAGIPSADPYGPYYPGDEYVDWVGLSFYHWGEDRGSNQAPYAGKWGFANGFNNPVPNFHDVYAAGRGKPMLIAETSALHDTNNSKGGGTAERDIKNAWIRQVYNTTNPWEPRLDRDFPQLKAIFWFNILKFESEVNGDVDWRLDANPDVAAFYRQTVSTPYFIQA